MTEAETVVTNDQTKDNSAERNFANLRKKAEMLEQEKEEYRKRLEDLERERKEAPVASLSTDDDDDDEPYVTPKKLKKEQSRYGEQIEKRVEQRLEQRVEQRLEEERRVQYLKENPDFNSVLSEESVKGFIEEHPTLAQSILGMPDNFERKKVVFETIKSLKNSKERVKSDIQSKIEQNRKSPYYKAPMTSTPPYGGVVDGPAAYKQMQELKSRLRLG